MAPLAPLVLASLQVCRKKFLYITYNTHSPCQSATHYSCFENMSRFVPLKNQVYNKDLKKAGFKKWGHCCSKREEAAWLKFFKFQTIRKHQVELINQKSGCRLTERLYTLPFQCTEPGHTRLFQYEHFLGWHWA